MRILVRDALAFTCLAALLAGLAVYTGAAVALRAAKRPAAPAARA